MIILHYTGIFLKPVALNSPPYVYIAKWEKNFLMFTEEEFSAQWQALCTCIGMFLCLYNTVVWTKPAENETKRNIHEILVRCALL